VPSWPAVIVGAVVVGAVLGAAQNGDVDLPVAAPAEAGESETATTEGDEPLPSPSPPPRVRVTLPPQPAPRVALTFDDGPHPQWTPQVLDVLARHDALATFCVVGEQIPGNEDVLRRIHAEGHRLCNHTASHDYGLPARPPGEIRDEIASVNNQISKVVPEAEVVVFRAPGGRFTSDVVDAAADLGMTSWGWSIDPMDWRTSETSVIVTSVLDAVAPDAVILLHDGGGDRSATIAAVAELVPVLASVGYEFVTLPAAS
jgi:peptidoglycan/xylan/chitin deacetylase (PgdA/CDA1 family)